MSQEDKVPPQSQTETLQYEIQAFAKLPTACISLPSSIASYTEHAGT